MAATRRQFLHVAAGLGGSLGISAAVWLQRQRGLQVVSRTAWALGAEVKITALHNDTATAEAAISAAFAELDCVEAVMSLYRPESQICQLNRTGELDRPDPYLVEVFHAALELSSRTGGAFDVTVQPLWSLYAAARKWGGLPEVGEIERARSLVDWRRVQLLPGRIELPAGMQITLNGIAQGFAADRAVAAMRRYGVEHALVNAGEIGTLGGRTSKEPWKVGIQHPRQADAYVALLPLEGRSLATSGDYATPFADDFSRHHIFDPRTGLSPTEFASVSIVAPSGMQADALSTAVFVLGLERGMTLMESIADADAFLVLKDGRTLATAGFPQAT